MYNYGVTLVWTKGHTQENVETARFMQMPVTVASGKEETLALNKLLCV